MEKNFHQYLTAELYHKNTIKTIPKTTDVIPYLSSSQLSKIEWFMVSNAELKSIITNIVSFLESMASLIDHL